MRTRLGILGGTFDPIHVGHLRTAVELREEGRWQEVRLIPCGVPPHRQTPCVAAHHRLAMAGLAAGQTPGLTVDDREVRCARPAYTVETLRGLRRDMPAADLILVVGMDQFVKFTTWYRWQDVFSLANLVVVERPGETAEIADSALREKVAAGRVERLEDLHRAVAGHVCFWRGTQLAVSATQIRTAVLQGRSIQYLVPEPVRRYITQHNLYRDSCPDLS